MAKPKWLVEHEAAKSKTARFNHCFDCFFKGEPVGFTRYHDKGKYVQRRCTKHPKCVNTEFSLACDDFIHE